MTDAPDDATVVGKRHRPARRNLILFVLFVVLYASWGILSGHYQLPLLALFYALFFGLWSLRPPTIVSAAGIRRSWQPRSVVSWGEVASVVSPTIGLPGVRLQLTSGKVLVLHDIPADRTSEVAAIGNRPIERMPVPRPRTVSSPQQDPTPSEMEADVERRARALAEERRKMESSQRRPTNRLGG